LLDEHSFKTPPGRVRILIKEFHPEGEEMVAKLQQGVLPFKIEKSDEPLIARAGLVLPYEMTRALKHPRPLTGNYHCREAAMPISPRSLLCP